MEQGIRKRTSDSGIQESQSEALLQISIVGISRTTTTTRQYIDVSHKGPRLGVGRSRILKLRITDRHKGSHLIPHVVQIISSIISVGDTNRRSSSSSRRPGRTRREKVAGRLEGCCCPHGDDLRRRRSRKGNITSGIAGIQDSVGSGSSCCVTTVVVRSIVIVVLRCR